MNAKIKFPAGLYKAFKNYLPTDFLNYASKNSDYYIKSDEIYLLNQINLGKGSGLLSASQMPKKIKLSDSETNRDIKISVEQANYFIQLRSKK